MTISAVIKKEKLSVKFQTLATLVAVVAAVAIPQLFHAVGAISGLGRSLGQAFLPMHLPIMLVGLIAGPWAGAAAGLMGPVASFLLSGMPDAATVPFMMIELFGYGLCAGLLRNAKMPVITKTLFIQIGGRVLRAAATLIAVYMFNSTAVAVSTVLTSITAGLFGIILQLAFIPLIMYRIENARKNEE